MKFEVLFTLDSENDIRNAFGYYEEKILGLGKRFLEQIEIYVQLISKNPLQFPEKRKPYREAFIKNFPYILIYEIIESKILIYALFNTSQNPEKKFR